MEASEAEKQTLPVIQAAEKWVKRFEGNYSRSYTPADYFNNLPIDSDGKPGIKLGYSFDIHTESIGRNDYRGSTGLQQINETDSKLHLAVSCPEV